MVFFRHGFLQDNDLGPLYDLLIDDPPDIRRAIGGLVYDHLIAQKFSTSQRKGWNFLGSVLHYDLQAMKLMFMKIFVSGNASHSSKILLGRMLQILREFSADPILGAYVIDDIWEYMSAMKVCLGI